MSVGEDINETASKMGQFPPDWWQTVAAATALLQKFTNHVIPLLVAGIIDNSINYSVYSGILLRYERTIVWLTAGHIVDELVKVLSSPDFKLTTMVWLDDFGAKGAEGVRLHNTGIPMKSWKSAGLDVGAVLPSDLDLGRILKNNKVQPIDAGIWKNRSSIRPEGFYAIGFPRPWSIHTKMPALIPALVNDVLISLKTDLSCLPLEVIQPPRENSDDPTWSDLKVFYGKILPYSDNPINNLDSPMDMSGGPILSFERTAEGHIAYSLVGVIQSWVWAQSIIRAEAIDCIADEIDRWLNERNLENGKIVLD
jgi:hypothetical protein